MQATIFSKHWHESVISKIPESLKEVFIIIMYKCSNCSNYVYISTEAFPT